MKGDPTPVCRYCGDYTPEWGHYFEALEQWVCYSCLATTDIPSDREVREAIESIRMAT